MNHDNLLSISRTSSSKVISSDYIFTTSFMIDRNSDDKSLVGNGSPVAFRRFSVARSGFSKLIKSFHNVISIHTILPTFRWLSLPSQLSVTPSLGRKVTGTLFGNWRGQVSFAVQNDPRSAPVLIIELAVSTATLVKEMASGMVRIALECEKFKHPVHKNMVVRGGKLAKEPVWTMYCNGRKCGHASLKACSDSDWHVLSTVQSVSVGAGVIPVLEDCRKNNAGGSEGELVYMRAKFERVVGSRDSEAYYMMNPDQNGGPELSIFMLRI
ncbi:putative protein MIZU-KUSSEI 1-like, plant [Helianthus annuus]|nr:putative protein MIZU-KUSSEI 1-like, plant [Helianthus annuus]